MHTVMLRFGKWPLLAGLLVGLMLLAAQARAADVDISAFFGKWQGKGVSESRISLNFTLTSRDIGVELRASEGGFTLSWNTVQRQRGDPSNPTERLKASEMRFREVRAGTWQGIGTQDPVASGEPYAWAYVERNTLVINILQVHGDGRYEMQTYRRTLEAGAMTLEFTRMVDGREVRTARGRLVKVAK